MFDLKDVRIANGASFADINGRIGANALDLDWDVDLRSLAVAVPGMAGTLVSRGTAHGTLARPVIAGTARVRNFDYAGVQVASFDAEADIDSSDKRRSSVAFSASTIEAAGLVFDFARGSLAGFVGEIYRYRGDTVGDENRKSGYIEERRIGTDERDVGAMQGGDGAWQPKVLLFEHLNGEEGAGGMRDGIVNMEKVGRFSGRRQRMPGQDTPGLGLAREMAELLALTARRLELDGVAFKPAWYHMAYIARDRFRFADPRRQGRFEAMLRDLAPLGLVEVSTAMAEGRVRLDGQAYTWEAEDMVWWGAPRSPDAAPVTCVPRWKSGAVSVTSVTAKAVAADLTVNVTRSPDEPAGLSADRSSSVWCAGT